MSDEKKTGTDIESAAEAAAALEKAAKAEPDTMIYTHTFKEPFQFRGHTVTELSFNWGGLTGEDFEAIEDDMLRHGKTLVTPSFTGAFLAGMAVRACTDRDANGIRIVDADMLRALPIRDYQNIYMSARRFLLRSGL